MAGGETCLRQLLSCAGLGWGLHRLLSNQSLLEIGRRSATYKPMLALLSFLARSDQRSPEGKHLYVSIFVTPLQPKGWVGVPSPAEPEVEEASKQGDDTACAPRRSQRAKGPAPGKQKAAASDEDAAEVDLASMDTMASLLASLKTQASMFVSLAKSGGSAAGASSSSSKGKGGAVKQPRGVMPRMHAAGACVLACLRA